MTRSGQALVVVVVVAGVVGLLMASSLRLVQDARRLERNAQAWACINNAHDRALAALRAGREMPASEPLTGHWRDRTWQARWDIDATGRPFAITIVVPAPEHLRHRRLATWPKPVSED